MDAGLIDFAKELAAAARAQTLGRFARGDTAENKGIDAYDPVTEADREAERVMRKLIRDLHPDHGVSGEEWADDPGTSSYRWSLDPVDGTRSFICGLPTWTTLIALLDADGPILGVIDAPVLDETYIGATKDAWLTCRGERTQLRTSGCTRVADARFSTTDPFLMFEDQHLLGRLRRSVRVNRYGHDGYAYARLAAGTLDLIVESGLKPHDYNALIPVIRSAGGHIGDWRGGTDFAAGQVVAAATRELYDEVAELLAAA